MRNISRVERAIAQYQGAEILQIKDPIFEMHKGGKIHSGRKRDVRTLAQLRYVYTPGVARVCTAIHQDAAKAREYTNIGNSVGIFTNGTRVLGLGDIGVLASMPLMEGKAVVYDRFGRLGNECGANLLPDEDCSRRSHFRAGRQGRVSSEHFPPRPPSEDY
ncbi:MAG: hypothetical protein A3G20_07910 [Acidobacteria bacterium RIFCSPLOWO2_12_FULL_59_11]|nr:MAG: hypothetical protein A3G20_07910 [Acidobacteria bacterium RIFCSPLOWO2_12_FULL_59_11]